MTITYLNFKVSTLPYKTLLLGLLFLKSIILLGFIVYGNIGLGPDEAQYWTWSQSLDWGYYSKPPGIAWQIWLGTQWFGNTELGVRFLSVVMGIAQAFAIYWLAIQCRLESRTAFWCGIIMAFSPVGVIGSFLAITDIGFLLFWTLACTAIAAALKDSQPVNPFLIGILIAVGALFKWPIYILWAFFFLCRYWYFSHQPLKNSIGGVLLSLLGLLPSLWWNITHDWATFRHVTSTVQGGHANVVRGNILEFIGSQILLFSPIFFFLFLLAAYQWFKKRSLLNNPLIFCGAVSILSLLAFFVASGFQKIQGNWAVFAYPTSIILIGWYACEWNPGKTPWIKWGLAVSILLMIGIFASPLPYKISPFKHNIGWKSLQQGLDEGGYQPNQHFLFSDKYQTTSLLSFYNTNQKRAYFLNIHGIRKNQFSYWPSLQEEQKGKIGYFVWIESTPQFDKNWNQKFAYYKNELPKYFQTVEFAGVIPLIEIENDTITKAAFIFKCSHCKDQIPLEPELY